MVILFKLHQNVEDCKHPNEQTIVLLICFRIFSCNVLQYVWDNLTFGEIKEMPCLLTDINFSFTAQEFEYEESIIQESTEQVEVQELFYLD